MPKLGSDSSQAAYDQYKPGNGKTYDLLLITPTAGLHTLADFLETYNRVTNIDHSLSKARAGDMVVFDDNGVAQHTVLIVKVGSSTSSTLIDAHNAARHNDPLSDEISGFDSWYMLHLV